MSKILLFSVRDAGVGAFMPPIAARSVGEASRSFGDAVRAPESPFGLHPTDYALFKVAEFDTVTGIVEALLQPLMVEAAVTFVSGGDLKVVNDA